MRLVPPLLDARHLALQSALTSRTHAATSGASADDSPGERALVAAQITARPAADTQERWRTTKEPRQGADRRCSMPAASLLTRRPILSRIGYAARVR
eukprot:6191329-Pleurochrysis_carterae.AAC.5